MRVPGTGMGGMTAFVLVSVRPIGRHPVLLLVPRIDVTKGTRDLTAVVAQVWRVPARTITVLPLSGRSMKE
jgi:hypothetical protein